MSDDLMYTNIAAARVSRALRQMPRMQAAHAAVWAEADRLGVQREMPESWVTLHEQFEDEMYFMIVAVRQAISARTVLAERGHDMPEIRNTAALTAWRDVLEHWDDPARTMPEPIRALGSWRREGREDEPGLSFGSEGELTEMSGVSLVDLREDLDALRDAIRSLSNEQFDQAWATAERAAEHLRTNDPQVLDGIPYMDFSDVGVRYARDWIDARLAGHAIPPSWQRWMEP